jgi:hypothetical protein
MNLPFQDMSLNAQVDALNHHFIDLWWRGSADPPSLGPAYTTHQQAGNEAQLGRLIASLTAAVKHPPLNASERSQARDHMTLQLVDFAGSVLGFEDRLLKAIQSWGIIEAAGTFVQMARQLDPDIRSEDIYQAGRNVMSMNFMQLLIGLPVDVTPAVFAYSMLYPYTDNYLDNPAITRETKRDFSERFARRLAGESIVPANAHEETVYVLVGLIEDQFDRLHYPQVFESLLAIHTAQSRSLLLHQKDASPYEIDVLGLGFEKGGTSVLADGYLVAGSISQQQAEFMYGYGAFTQLMDDLEDVQQDLDGGIATVFSQTARHWPLDGLTNRLFELGREVFSSERMACFEGTDAHSLRDLMEQCLNPLLIDSVGRASRYYSQGYLRELEHHSPFRFDVVRKHRKRLGRHLPAMMRLAEMLTIPGPPTAYQLYQTSARRIVPLASGSLL